MLVLSAQATQTIQFPNVGIRVDVLRDSRGVHRVIVDAPSDSEIIDKAITDTAHQEWKHELRNKLYCATLAIEVLHRQLDDECFNSAERTLEIALESLETLDQVASERPASLEAG